jgi:hypothetical protein
MIDRTPVKMKRFAVGGSRAAQCAAAKQPYSVILLCVRCALCARAFSHRPRREIPVLLLE